MVSRAPRINRVALGSAGGLLVAACAALSWRQVQYWQSGFELFQHASAVTNNNFLAEAQIAVAYGAQGRVEEAMAHYARALRYKPNLRDAHYKGAKRLGHGEGYDYAHDHKDHFVAQDYLGAAKRYYEPTDQGVEKKIKERVERWRAEFEKLRAQKRND